jgi:hypothetical protein
MRGDKMRLFWLIVSTAAVAALLAPAAAADRVYHSEHLRLAPVGTEPLRSGFVQNIKANGPRIYAHEIFVLNGARPGATYTVERNFFFANQECTGEPATFDVATLRTNAAGNARADVVIRPSEITIDGKHGVMWTVRDASGTLAYETRCTVVTLD